MNADGVKVLTVISGDVSATELKARRFNQGVVLEQINPNFEKPLKTITMDEGMVREFILALKEMIHVRFLH